MKALSRRAVKQDRVALSFPNCREFDRPRAMEAEVDSAGPVAANENSLGKRKGADFKLIVLAKDCVDVVS